MSTETFSLAPLLIIAGFVVLAASALTLVLLRRRQAHGTLLRDSALVLCGLGLAFIAGGIGAVWVRGGTAYAKQVVIDDRTADALEQVVEHRFAAPPAVDALERWLNAYVRAVPRKRKQRTVMVVAEQPKHAIQKIADGKVLTDHDRIRLLEWVAFETECAIEPIAEELLKGAVAGVQLEKHERIALSQWLSMAPEFPRERKLMHSIKRWPDSHEHWSPSPPAPPAPDAAPEAPVAPAPSA